MSRSVADASEFGFLLNFEGGYILMAEKLPQYVVPDLTDFKVSTTTSFCDLD